MHQVNHHGIAVIAHGFLAGTVEVKFFQIVSAQPWDLDQGRPHRGIELQVVWVFQRCLQRCGLVISQESDGGKGWVRLASGMLMGA